MRTLIFDLEVCFQPQITNMCEDYGLDEKKLSWKINANMQYITHISYMFAGAKKTKDLSVLDYKGPYAGAKNEKALLEDFSKVYNTADSSVAHYGSKFDINFLNSRLAFYDLPPLKPIPLHDTWRILKYKFLINSNSLDAAIKFFKCPFAKPSIPWCDWQASSRGDTRALRRIRHRCQYDVLSLEWIYTKKLRNYVTNKPNQGLRLGYSIDNTRVKFQLACLRCPHCGGLGSMTREGYRTSQTTMNVRLVCHTCRGWSQAPVKRVKRKDQKEYYILGIVR